MTLQGLNPNGGDNTMLVDAVKLNSVLVANGGFETPVLATGTYTMNPSGATWSFTGTSGIAKNSSAFTNKNPNAPEGTQVGIVRMTGSISQPLSLSGGSYTFSTRAAQRGSVNPTYQQVRVTLLGGFAVTSTKQFVWNGNSIAEERDGSNAVTRRFYAQGEQISGASYYYARDHLGSVRELTDSTGAIRARYDYNPYGYRIKVSGDLDAQFGFTGHYYHQQSGLNLALNRAYDASTGRWLSRDPLENAEMSQGPNLYSYIGNNPINETDPLGLCPGDFWDLLYQFMLGAEEGAYAAIDGATPFWDPFSDRYSLNDAGIGFSFGAGAFSRNVLLAAGGLSAMQAANGYFMPSTLYHFTSLEGAASIEATGGIQAGSGLYGTGTYLTGFNSATMATIQGASATETAIAVSTEGLSVTPTYFPGTYIVRGASVLIK